MIGDGGGGEYVGDGEFGLLWEGGVVTSSSLVRSTKRGLDRGLMVILGFLEM